MSAVYEVPPSGCPYGHRWVVGRRTHMVGWDNLHKPRPCRVYYCSTLGCDGRVWVESVEYRPV